MNIQTVRDLREALVRLPDDLPIGLCVYHHSWYSNCHTDTHGSASIDIVRFGSGQKIVVISAGGRPTDGYQVQKIT